jgi:hypothetical protein
MYRHREKIGLPFEGALFISEAAGIVRESIICWRETTMSTRRRPPLEVRDSVKLAEEVLRGSPVKAREIAEAILLKAGRRNG